jgi:hypothetical protein
MEVLMAHVQALFIAVFLAVFLIPTGAQPQDSPDTPAKVVFVGDLKLKGAKEADGGKSSRVPFALSSPAKIGGFSTFTPVWVQIGKDLNEVKALVQEATKKKEPSPHFLAEGTFAFDGESAVLTGTVKPLAAEEQVKWRGGPSVVVEGEVIHQKYDIAGWKFEMAVKNGKHPILIGGDLVAKHAKTTGKIRVFGGATVNVEKSGTRYLAVYAEKIETVGIKGGKQSNPFGVADVPDPNGKDVRDFAATVKLAGDGKDSNAKQWAPVAVKGDKGSLDGEWYGRWSRTAKVWVPEFKAQVKAVGDRVYILYTDHQGRFLIDLRREKDRLVGRIQGIDNPNDTDPCVFEIVDPERLDGTWGGKGRLDFRRKLK